MSSGQSGQVRAVIELLSSLELPAPFKAHDATLVASRVDDEVEGVVEPVVDVLARLVGDTEAEVESPVRERQLVHAEAHAPLAVAGRPAEGSQVDRVPGDERAGVVAQLELEARRRDTVAGRDSDAELERLPGEELEAIRALPPDECRRGDRSLARAPLPQADAELRRARLVRERSAITRDGLSRRTVERDPPALEVDRALAEALDRSRVVRDEDDRSALPA